MCVEAHGRWRQQGKIKENLQRSFEMTRKTLPHVGKERASPCEKKVMKAAGRSLKTSRHICKVLKPKTKD